MGLRWALVLGVGLLAAPLADAQTKPKSKTTKVKTAKPKAAKPKPKRAAAAAAHDPMTEWELVNGAAGELREKIAKQPRIEALRQAMADLAVRSAGVGAEYAAGTGAPKDVAEARKWLEQAERGGIANARQVLEWMDKGNPEKPSK